MSKKTIKDINEYKGSTVNPMNFPDTVFELYSVPSFEQNYPEIIKGSEIGSSKVTVQENDILVCKINPRINRVWKVKHNTEHQLLASSEWIIIRSPQNNADYLKWYFQSPVFRTYMNSALTGIGGSLTRAQPKQVANYPVPLPPLSTQKQIAATLDKATHTIDLCNAILEKLDLLVKARFMEITESDANVTPTKMGDIATYINGYAFKPTDWSENGLPIIRIQNLNDLSAKFNYYNGDLPEKYTVVDGDVLVSWATHLEAYIWNRGKAWLNQHIFKTVFDKMEVDKTYFVYATEEALRQAFKNAHGFKPTMEHIKRSDFENAVVQLPSIQTQRLFAAFVEKTDRTKAAVKQVLAKAETLKKALMQEYFG